MLGIDPAESSAGPPASVEVSDGRALDGDAGESVAVIDATYASTADLAVGGIDRRRRH